MIDLSDIKFHFLAVHKVGNKLREENFRMSDDVIVPKGEQLKELLIKYFTGSFRFTEFFHLHHDTDLELNEVFSYVSKIFENAIEFFPQTVNLARHLYEKSTHPKVNGGEFYVVFFRDCIVDDESVDAIGLFKSESRETYLKVKPENENFSIEYDDGININKLDKGAIIFNTEKEKGYLVSMVDHQSRSGEAHYWKDDFLHLRPREDEYHHTENILGMCKEFVVNKLAEDFEVTLADQADMLNKSIGFFKSKDRFDLEEFSSTVMQQPDVIDAFKEYSTQYEEEHQVKIVDNFDISDPAVKKQSRIFKSVIKLDKNFHIYVHGNRELIEKGYDDSTGLSFYKLFFKEEN